MTIGVRIDELQDGGPVTDATVFAGVKGGNTKKFSAESLITRAAEVIIPQVQSSIAMLESTAELKALDVTAFSTAFLAGYSYRKAPALAYAGWITADPGEHIVVPSTDDVAFVWVRQYERLTPGLFGANKLGTEDATDQIKLCIDFCRGTQQLMEFDPSAKYLVTSTLWFGKDDCSIGVRGLMGNNATIVSQVDGEAIMEFAGIQNGLKFPIWNFRVEALDGVNIPTCAISQSRVKQPAGVVSSGNAVIFGVTVYGHFHVAPYYNIQSESNTLLGNHFFQYRTSGHAAVFSRFDYFKDMFVMEWDAQTEAFTPGDTVTGATSGATAKIVRRVFTTGATGRAWCLKLAGTFVDNEIITGAGGGSATTNFPAGYFVIPAALSSTALGPEENSTSSHIDCMANYFNNTSANSIDATVFVESYIDIAFHMGNNFNHGAEDGWHLHFQQDKTCQPAKSTGCNFRTGGNYHHSSHAVSIAFGDPVNGGGNYEGIELQQNKSTGDVSTVVARVKYVGNPLGSAGVGLAYNWSVETDFGLDIRGCQFISNNMFSLRDVNYGNFKCDQLVEGVLWCSTDTDVQITTPDSSNRLTVHYTDLGVSATRRRSSATISAGTASISSNMALIGGEGNANDDLVTLNFDGAAPQIHGQIIGLRALTSGHTITIRSGIAGSNFQTANNKRVKLNSQTYTLFQWEAAAARWVHLGSITNGEATQAGFTANTGTDSKGAVATHTVSGTAVYTAPDISAAYVEAEVQAVADAAAAGWAEARAVSTKLKETTEQLKAMKAALIDAGVLLP